ncbi:cbb3-type cytochrome oxidase subunit 3 [Sphaerotilus sp.]|uniref:cbb3-type cytochrome oxidase subunit 3 n=1 Tax=Sphaerotilus sp. TaxID=2093942 RepID=UPI0025E44656|nr:cbb3-type cytochrome c oxidase subunit 3 [Sphaerotilus sp.]
MDIVNDLRSFATVGFFLLFLGIVAWAYASRNRSGFEEAAALPFLDDDQHKASNASNASNGGTHE